MSKLKGLVFSGIVTTIFLFLFYLIGMTGVIGILRISLFFTVGISILYFMDRLYKLGAEDSK